MRTIEGTHVLVTCHKTERCMHPQAEEFAKNAEKKLEMFKDSVQV